MTRFCKILSWTSFSLAAFTILIAPWLFGAWEAWWFWPFASILFASVLCYAARLIAGDESVNIRLLWEGWPIRVACVSAVLFLVYAAILAFQADVYMTAERSLLLHLTPALLAVLLITGFDRKQLYWIFILVVIDMFLLGLYGVVNHHATGSALVMWTPGVEQYAGRATGSFFCPDHFSGTLEILLACSLGVLLGRGRLKVPELLSDTAGPDGSRPRRRRRSRTLAGAYRVVALAFAVVALLGIWLSKSRGGGITVVVMFAVGLALGFQHLRLRMRWIVRAAAVAIGLIVLAVVWNSTTGYVTRFKTYFGWDNIKDLSHGARVESLMKSVKGSARYNMYSAAYRAWQTKKWTGIGPGMHQHLWPHYAPSPDGDRATGKRPSRLNFKRYSYEVHSDWLQLLEEYGIVGLVLFCIPIAAITVLLLIGLYHDLSTTAALSGILTITALAFHSLGDFNLQIPAVTWLGASIISIAAAHVLREED